MLPNGEVEGPDDHARQAPRAHNLSRDPRRQSDHASRPPPTIVSGHSRVRRMYTPHGSTTSVSRRRSPAWDSRDVYARPETVTKATVRSACSDGSLTAPRRTSFRT